MADQPSLGDLSLAEKEVKTEPDDNVQATKGNSKIDVILMATGDAPILKKKRWAIEQDKKVGSLIEFLKKLLKVEPTENLFLYVNQCFAPSPDQILRNLYSCFGADGKLTLHYCKTQAWG